MTGLLVLLALCADKPLDAAQAAAKKVIASPPTTQCEECREACLDDGDAACRALCNSGKFQACTILATQQLEGHPDGEPLPREALTLLEKSAAQHEPIASGTLGLLYVSGQGVKKNAKKGVALLGESCVLGYWPACHTLAQAYEKGDGVPKDPKLAVERYRDACSHGYAQSCLTVGDLYERGVGIPADKLQAVQLYQVGCGRGSPQACEAVKRLQSVKPVDTPVSVTGEASAKLEKAMAPLIEKARSSWPAVKKRYLAGLPKGERLFVTTKLLEPDGTSEQCFVEVRGVDPGQGPIRGVLGSDIIRIKRYHRGDALEVNEKDLMDWTISKPDGTEEGNIVGKFLDTWKP